MSHQVALDGVSEELVVADEDGEADEQRHRPAPDVGRKI